MMRLAPAGISFASTLPQLRGRLRPITCPPPRFLPPLKGVGLRSAFIGERYLAFKGWISLCLAQHFSAQIRWGDIDKKLKRAVFIYLIFKIAVLNESFLLML